MHMSFDAAQISLVISCYLGAGNAAAGGYVPTKSSVGGSATVLAGVQKEVLKNLTDDAKPLKEVATRPVTSRTSVFARWQVVRMFLCRYLRM